MQIGFHIPFISTGSLEYLAFPLSRGRAVGEDSQVHCAKGGAGHVSQNFIRQRGASLYNSFPREAHMAPRGIKKYFQTGLD